MQQKVRKTFKKKLEHSVRFVFFRREPPTAHQDSEEVGILTPSLKDRHRDDRKSFNARQERHGDKHFSSRFKNILHYNILQRKEVPDSFSISTSPTTNLLSPNLLLCSSVLESIPRKLARQRIKAFKIVLWMDSFGEVNYRKDPHGWGDGYQKLNLLHLLNLGGVISNFKKRAVLAASS